MSHKLFALAVISTLLLVFSFQNCGKGFVAVDHLSSSAPLSSYDEQCLQNLTFDACLFKKNAVSAAGASQKSQTASVIDDLQTHGVMMDAFTNTGELKNSSFLVYENGKSAVLSKDPVKKWNYRYSQSLDRTKLMQVMAFYWMNFAAVNSLQTTGLFHAFNKEIKVIIGGSVFGWIPGKNQIHLLSGADVSAMALDASAMIYFLGWANLDYANNGKIHQYTKENHLSCSTGTRDCCKTQNGCARAIASGVADYLVAMTFPENAAVGDGLSDRIDGKSICQTQYERNPLATKNLTLASSYNLCGSGKLGDIYAMGSVYASIWWSVRSLPSSNASEVDRLYMLHLAQLNGDDTFLTAKDKILALDRTHFSGRYSQAFISEFGRR